MFNWFEQLLNPTEPSAEMPPPGSSLLAFHWHYVRQVKSLVLFLFLTGAVIAILDTAIPIFIGRLVSLISAQEDRELMPRDWEAIAFFGFLVLIVRPGFATLQNLITNQVLFPGLMNLIRWQSHWHVIRQSWSFFQNDFAGRIANRVMQTAPALRDTVVLSANAVWYIIVYGGSAFAVLWSHDIRLAAPVFIWFSGYIALLYYFVPRLRERSRAAAEVRSTLTGRIVDSYTNIVTVKLFARSFDEDDFVRESIEAYTFAYQRQLRMLTLFISILMLMNSGLLVITGGVALWLWSTANIAVGTVAMALPLVWQIANMSGRVAQNVSTIFENVGTVQDGMRSIAVPRQLPDKPGAVPLLVSKGSINFKNVRFGYGTNDAVLKGIDLSIAPGERIGLVGSSGAGKSTLINLLLRLFEVESGKILIDGQDISGVTQESLRAHISVVTQDTSLLHRSIRDNIRYGRPNANECEIREASRRSQALSFIDELEDWHGRRGFDAYAGERGVKLSGGQRQRIALARVILKDAPIFVLDEATSALDSEVEAVIQEQLDDLMDGRTVIAIAHRLSTIARMDRLVVMESGRIVETGTHSDLMILGGVYCRLWRKQYEQFLTGEASPQSERVPDKEASCI